MLHADGTIKKFKIKDMKFLSLNFFWEDMGDTPYTKTMTLLFYWMFFLYLCNPSLFLEGR